MTWKIIATDSPGSSVKYGGNDLKKVMQYLSGTDLATAFASDAANINSKTTFSSEKFRILSPTTGFSYIFRSKDIAADRYIDLPLMTGNGEISLAGTNAVNDWGANMQTFRDDNLSIRNPANTFSYILSTGAILANRIISLPVLIGDDTFAFCDAEQTLSNKTLVNPTIATWIANVDAITLKHSATNLAGDLLSSNGTKYNRKPRGGPNTFLAMNSSGSDSEWRDISSLGGGGGGGGSVSGDHLVPTVGNVLTGAWYGTSTIGGSGVWNNFLTSRTSVTPLNISDSSGRIGLRYNFTVDDDRAGFRTNDEYFTLQCNPEFYVRYKMSLNGQSDDYRLIIGLVSNVNDDFGSDDELNNKSAICWFKETADTSITVGINDGDASQTKDSAVSLSSTNESINTIKIVGDSTNSRWGFSLNGANLVYFNSEIPALTTRLGAIVQIENEDSADRSCEIYGAWWKGTAL